MNSEFILEDGASVFFDNTTIQSILESINYI